MNDFTNTRRFITDWLFYLLVVLFCGGVSNTLWLFEDISTVWKLAVTVLLILEVIGMTVVLLLVGICLMVEKKHGMEKTDAGQP